MAFEEINQLIKCKPNSNRNYLEGIYQSTTASFTVSGKAVSLF